MSTVKERPILFNGEMVRAILDGRKTQTRRGLNVQPPSDEYRLLRVQESSSGKDEGKNFWGKLNSEKTLITDSVRSYFTCPYGKPGERLWVRETFSEFDDGLVYRASHPQLNGVTKWTPSIHMPRWASRITLEITSVRVKRLQDISEEDAQKEGVEDTGKVIQCWKNYMPTNNNAVAFNTARASFESLWKSINGPESWDANPWVWVIEFKRID